LLGQIARHQIAPRPDLALKERTLRLDHFMHNAFAQSEASRNVRRTNSHLSEPEDLLFVGVCKSENRLNHRARPFCPALRKLCSGVESAQ